MKKIKEILVLMVLTVSVLALVPEIKIDAEEIEFTNANLYEYAMILSRAEKAREKVVMEKSETLKERKENDSKSREPYIISGLNAEGINDKLHGTYLSGMGEVLYFIEQELSVNFRFIYAIGALESGYGKHLAGGFNYFGLSNGKGGYSDFASKGQVLRYLGKLLASDLYKNKSLEGIALIYCPPNHVRWAKDVRFIISEI